jgi:hypothetical protein
MLIKNLKRFVHSTQYCLKRSCHRDIHSRDERKFFCFLHVWVRRRGAFLYSTIFGSWRKNFSLEKSKKLVVIIFLHSRHSLCHNLFHLSCLSSNKNRLDSQKLVMNLTEFIKLVATIGTKLVQMKKYFTVQFMRIKSQR